MCDMKNSFWRTFPFRIDWATTILQWFASKQENFLRSANFANFACASLFVSQNRHEQVFSMHLLISSTTVIYWYKPLKFAEEWTTLASKSWGEQVYTCWHMCRHGACSTGCFFPSHRLTDYTCTCIDLHMHKLLLHKHTCVCRSGEKKNVYRM